MMKAPNKETGTKSRSPERTNGLGEKAQAIASTIFDLVESTCSPLPGPEERLAQSSARHDNLSTPLVSDDHPDDTASFTSFVHDQDDTLLATLDEVQADLEAEREALTSAMESLQGEIGVELAKHDLLSERLLDAWQIQCDLYEQYGFGGSLPPPMPNSLSMPRVGLTSNYKKRRLQEEEE